MPFVYGPLTQEQADAVQVSKSQVPEPDGFYIGTTVELPEYAHLKIFKWVPPVIEEAPAAETPAE